MVSLMLEELAPAEEKASIRRLMKRMAGELDKLLDALEVKAQPAIADTLRADAERTHKNLAAMMSLALQNGASEPRMLEEIGKYRVHQALLEQHLIHTLLTLPSVPAAQPARGDVH
ncbi:MAG: hypothetical protein H0T76_14330 [Nannocystis sp.]|nr:hypothetical protein [Nannocystis sp.]